MKFISLMMAFFLGMGVGSGLSAGLMGGDQAGPPLPPEGIRMVRPVPGLPPEIRAFAGRWAGVWIDPCIGQRHPELLVVEEVISKDEVKVVFSWGYCPVCRSKADWRRFSGKIAKLCIDWRKLPEPFLPNPRRCLGKQNSSFLQLLRRPNLPLCWMIATSCWAPTAWGP